MQVAAVNIVNVGLSHIILPLFYSCRIWLNKGEIFKIPLPTIISKQHCKAHSFVNV